MEAPLHVAAYSALTCLAPGHEPHFYMLLTGFSAAMQESIRQTLDRANRPYCLTFLSDPKTELFASFASLLGNFAPYYRLLLPELINEPRFLYIDSDTLPLLDLSPLFLAEMDEYAAGFVIDGIAKNALDYSFFQTLGRNPEGPSFNSGVMLVQREKWIEQNYWSKIHEFCKQYGDRLISHDQTVLNAFFAENCYRLPANCNIKVYARRSSTVGTAPGLYHFLGSPKPWDFLGKTMLPYSGSWFSMLKKTALPPSKKSLWRSGAYWKRAPHVLGGYYRMLKSSLKK